MLSVLSRLAVMDRGNVIILEENKECKRIIVVKENQQRMVKHPWASKRRTPPATLGQGREWLLEPSEMCIVGKGPNRSGGLF